MPEYLSPGVYVEEVERGPRPIEGVSTSTTALVGFTKRGPVNRPMLVTNIDQYQRFFGEFLGREYNEFGPHRYVPYAAQGFFANGGQRAYVLRLARLPGTPADDDPLTERYQQAFQTDGRDFAMTAWADLPTRGGTGHREVLRRIAAGATELSVGDLSGLALDRVLRVGDGPTREFVVITGFAHGAVQVNPPFVNEHQPGDPIRVLPAPPAASNRQTAVPTMSAEGSSRLRVANAAGITVNNDWLVVGPDERLDVARPTASNNNVLTLARPLLFSHPPTGAEPVPDDVVAYASAGGAASGQLAGAHGPATANAGELAIPTGSGLAAGDMVVVEAPADPNAGDREEIVTLGMPTTTGGNDVFPLANPLRYDHNDTAAVTVVTTTGTTTQVAPTPGIVLDASTNLATGDFVLVDDGPRTEVLQLGAGAGGGPVTYPTTPQPRYHHGAGVAVRRIGVPLTADVQLAAEARQGTNTISVPDTTTFGRGDVLQILSGGRTEHVAISDRGAAAGGNVTLTLVQDLQYTHALGTGVVPLSSGIRVVAGPARPDPARFPEPGTWGNGIRIDVAPSSLAQTTIASAVNPGDPVIDVTAAAGIEAGSLLRLPGNRYARVAGVSGNRVSIDAPGVPAGVTISAAQATAADPDVVGVQTVEFKLTFSYGPVVQILDEAFDGLSMDPRHSHYVARVVNGEAPDIPGSALVHVLDVLDRAVAPAMPTDPLPLLGTFYPGGGSDGLRGLGPAVFQGVDADDADARTGLYALLNQSGISIVAVPGQTSFDVQSALVAHCERHKYSFGVLDPIRNASLDDIQLQRSRFDSTYAALYYPWIEVFDTWEQRPAFVPPSGHVAGIYARTDSEVGVFKAPANAIVTNARDLERTITKAQQDVLNPKGINALRAFPGRGILVWGARTVSTTNPLWRYLNVRRLFIYIEESIDLGTQYAPFMINDVPLWNRLKASVRAFLLGAWRDGGLQGATEDEAFFVRCGLGETMVGADLLAGRVIVEVGVAPVRPAEFVIFRVSQIVRLD